MKMNENQLKEHDETLKRIYKFEARMEIMKEVIKMFNTEKYEDLLKSDLDRFAPETRPEMYHRWLLNNYKADPNNIESLIIYSIFMKKPIIEAREILNKGYEEEEKRWAKVQQYEEWLRERREENRRRDIEQLEKLLKEKKEEAEKERKQKEEKKINNSQKGVLDEKQIESLKKTFYNYIFQKNNQLNVMFDKDNENNNDISNNLGKKEK